MKLSIRLLINFLMIGVTASSLGLLPGCAKYEKSPAGVTSLPGQRAGHAPSFDGRITGGLRGFYKDNPQTQLAALPVSNDELWIIARNSDTQTQSADAIPGSGALMTKIADKEIPMPLKHTEVHASVSGYIGSVEVIQQFQNPYDTKIEAIYVFPLPHNAAVNEFIMTIGERRIRGIIRERKEAEEIYQAAKSQGYVASLLTEERPNVFTQLVANIEPGKAIDVTIKYFHTLDYVDGWYEFAFPMAVGPRYNPPGTTNGIGAVPIGQNGKSGQQTEIPYLKTNERNGHDISLHLDINAGVAIEEFTSRSHAIVREPTTNAENLTVSLAPKDTIPNKDFVLRYRVAGEKIKSSVLTHRDARGGFFSLMIYPPEELASLARQPLELVFVLDCSGSMHGTPIEQAKAAIERGLHLLQSGDSFQLINFSEKASRLGSQPLEATSENVQHGLSYLRQLNGDGPTMMIEGIRAALDFPHDPQRLRFVCFLTDGYIGNEAEILNEIHQRLGASRIFGFGVGSSVNRYLLDHMAKEGRGAVAYLGPRDDGGKVMEDFFNRISHAALTDVRMDWGTMKTSDIYPRTLPDLFVGRPIIVTGRCDANEDTTIRVSGLAANSPVSFDVPARVTDATAQHAGLPSVWARAKIADLSAQALHSRNADLPVQVKQVALDYNLMSAFTAFVAVDSSKRTTGTEGVTVPVAVPVPERVKYDTTVPEN